jgi:hypothetical protein
MAAMAAGDHQAAFRFHAEFGPTLRRAVAVEALRQGAGHLGPDDHDGVALDFCLDLCRAAGRWHAQGALPWVWARRQLRHRVAEAAGQLAFPLDTVDPPEPAPANAPLDPDPLETLEGLARRDTRCAALAHAARQHPRDMRVLLLLSQQRRQGDPSPAGTVGRELGLTPVAVRKAASRQRARLRVSAPESVAA